MAPALTYDPAMPADEKSDEKKQSKQSVAEEDQFTKASAIAGARGIADASPHEMAGALWDKADDDPVTRQEAAEAVKKLREGPEEE